MIPAALTDADLTTILDGCASERMELVARIRGKPGVCPHGEEQGKEVLCTTNDPCEYQRSFSGSELPHVHCGREAAALAVAEEPVPCPKCGSPTFTADIDDGPKRLCMNDACKWIAAEESGRLK